MKEESVIREFRDRLELFVASKINNKEDAKDVLQNALIKIFISYKSLDNKEKLTSWVYQITRNTIIDYYRKNKTSIPISNLPEELTTEDSLNEDLIKCITPFVNQLPENYKNALMHTDLGNLSQKEYAVKINKSYSGTKSIVQRARRKLKDSFNKCCQIETDNYGQVLNYSPQDSCSCE